MQTINKTAKLSQSCKVDRVLYTLPYLPNGTSCLSHHFAYRSEEKMMPSLLRSVEKVTSVTAVRMSWGDKGRILAILASCYDCDMQNLLDRK